MSGTDLSFRRVVNKTRRAMRQRRKHSTSSKAPGSSFSEESVESRYFPIDLDALKAAVARFFGRSCTSCSKLKDGGFHSIYVLDLVEDVTDDPEIPVEVIARIAYPTFSHDKMESEVATKMFIRARTHVPVPKIYFWDSDPDNSVGAEYMILERVAIISLPAVVFTLKNIQVPGECAEDAWDAFSKEQKAFVMEQLAEHMSEVFNLRLDSIGSLYLRKDPLKGAWKKSMKLFDRGIDDIVQDFEIGPMVCTMYCSDPEDEFPRSRVKNPSRGPFRSAGEWLSSIPEHELTFTRQHSAEALEESMVLTPPNRSGANSDTLIEVEAPGSKGDRRRQLDFAQSSLTSLMDVTKSYCGPAAGGLLEHLSTQFSLLHHDFRLSNLQVDPQTARITGILDWEATHSAPLWACARLPNWLGDTSLIAEEGGGDGGSLTSMGLQEDMGVAVPLRMSSPSAHRALSTANGEEVTELRQLFLQRVSPEWREALEVGHNWRKFQEICCFNWMSWTESSMMELVELYREQAVKHPGVPLDEEEVENRLRGSSGSDESFKSC